MQVDKSHKYKIGINEVLDYNYCSMYYKLKQDNPGVENMTELYDRVLRNCFSSYLNLLKSNSSANIGYLTRLWGKNWIKDKTMIKLMAQPSANSRDIYDKLRRNGIDALHSFHNLIKIGNQYPILVNKGYEINIGKNIVLTGKWEYVREFRLDDNTTVFQIIKFTHKKDKFQTMMQMRHDIELTAADLAFNSLFTVPERQVVYANIYKEKMVPSYRDEYDHSVLKETIINTVKCINNNIYNVSPDKRCFHCTYRNLCEDYIIRKGNVL